MEAFKDLATFVGIFDPDHYGAIISTKAQNDKPITIKVYDWNQHDRLVREHDYATVSDARTRNGRERLWAKLEWIVGAVPFFGGSISLGLYAFQVLPNADWKPFAASVGLIAVGAIIKVDAESRRGITAAISSALSERRIPRILYSR